MDHVKSKNVVLGVKTIKSSAVAYMLKNPKSIVCNIVAKIVLGLGPTL